MGLWCINKFLYILYIDIIQIHLQFVRRPSSSTLVETEGNPQQPKGWKLAIWIHVFLIKILLVTQF